MKIHTYFHWAYHKFGWKHKYNLGTGLFIWLFLLLTRPFGVYATDLSHFFALAMFLLPVGISFILISYLTDYLFTNWVKIELTSDLKMDGFSWLLKLILFVHVIYLMRLIRCDWECFEMLEYLEQWFAFVLMILLTYIPLALYGRSKYFHLLVGRSEDENGNLSIKGDGKDRLTLNTNELILVKADDNYVDFYISDSDEPIRKTIRATLTSIVDQLSQHPQFQRVHRSFIVNLRYTEKRNFKKLAVKKGEWSMEIPLSPSFKDAVRSLV